MKNFYQTVDKKNVMLYNFDMYIVFTPNAARKY